MNNLAHIINEFVWLQLSGRNYFKNAALFPWQITWLHAIFKRNQLMEKWTWTGVIEATEAKQEKKKMEKDTEKN